MQSQICLHVILWKMLFVLLVVLAPLVPLVFVVSLVPPVSLVSLVHPCTPFALWTLGPANLDFAITGMHPSSPMPETAAPSFVEMLEGAEP